MGLYQTSRPSEELLNLVKRFAENLNTARDLWDEIRSKGANEGFDEHQLAEMVRPFLKERGLSQQQIWYLFHRDEQRQRSRDQYKKLTSNISSNDGKNVLEQNSTVVRDKNSDSYSVPSTSASTTSEIQEFEFELKHGWKMGLNDAVKACENSKTEVWIVKLVIKDNLLKRVENEMTGFLREDVSI